MTRPAYDPLRPPAPRFPRHRFQAAGLSEEATAAVAEQYEALDYDGRIRFVHDVTRVPNEELTRRYAEGVDAGASPALVSPAELADHLKIDQLRAAAKDAGVSAGGSKVDIATRLAEAGATGDLPVITPDQVAADAAGTPDPQSPPPGEAAAAPAEGTAPAPAAAAPTAPAADSPQVAPSAATDATGTPAATTAAADASTGTSAAPTTPVAPAAGTATDGGTTP